MSDWVLWCMSAAMIDNNARTPPFVRKSWVRIFIVTHPYRCSYIRRCPKPLLMLGKVFSYFDEHVKYEACFTAGASHR